MRNDCGQNGREAYSNNGSSEIASRFTWEKWTVEQLMGVFSKSLIYLNTALGVSLSINAQPTSPDELPIPHHAAGKV
jgi:hypothetical protein